MSDQPTFSSEERAAAERFGAKVRALRQAAEEGRLASMTEQEIDELMERALVKYIRHDLAELDRLRAIEAAARAVVDKAEPFDADSFTLPPYAENRRLLGKLVATLNGGGGA